VRAKRRLGARASGYKKQEERTAKKRIHYCVFHAIWCGILLTSNLTAEQGAENPAISPEMKMHDGKTQSACQDDS
jgi:hypothetical protein